MLQITSIHLGIRIHMHVR